MAMDLVNGASAERFDRTTWGKLLKLAYLYGWEPLGTEPGGWIDPETGPWYYSPDEWDGNYTSNDLQVVTEEDAARIADALDNALEDIPDHNVSEARVEHGPVSLFDLFRDRTDPLEYFSGAGGKQRVRDFVAFCRAGAFTIA